MLNEDFKGVWIPREIWLDNNLTLQEKVLLSRICYLDNEDGCFASNKYFSDFLDISKTRISLIIKSLKDKKYIISKTIYKGSSKEILNRVLKFSYIGYTTNIKQGMQEILKPPIQEKLKDNIDNINIQFNKDINNTYCSESLQTHELAKQQEAKKHNDLKNEQTEKPAFTLILNNKTEYPIYQKDINEWKEIYPNVDIKNEFRKIKGWCIANPTKRKTLRGIKRFINSWLAKEQDKGIENRESFNSRHYISKHENTSSTDGFSTEF